MPFNTVTYSVMGILLREPRTGYDIVKELQSFRPAKSSQIYPILAKLEKGSLATVEVRPQTGKPDKKVYRLTDTGKAHLLSWLDSSPEPPVIRDDFLSMLFSVWAKGPAAARRLIAQRRNALQRHHDDLGAKYHLLLAEYAVQINDATHWQFSTYLLVSRRLMLLEHELRWCDEILTRLPD